MIMPVTDSEQRLGTRYEKTGYQKDTNFLPNLQETCLYGAVKVPTWGCKSMMEGPTIILDNKGLMSILILITLIVEGECFHKE